MKKYHTIFVPTGKTLHVGGVAKYRHSLTGILDEESIVEINGLPESDLYRDVDLYIFTTNPDVGDEVFCIDVEIGNVDHYPNMQIDPIRIKGENDTCKACVKLIAKVSRAATWVWLMNKHIFDISEVNFTIQHHKFPDENRYVETYEEAQEFLQTIDKPERFTLIANIKCPTCKTFH
jgi:phage FluMu protein Com